MSELLHCPFCGGEASYRDDGRWEKVYDEGGAIVDFDISSPSVFIVECSCGAQIISDESEGAAIAAWNSRAGKDINVATNADRIRGMSDEELQKFLHEFESGDIDYAKTFCDLCCKDAALERRSVDCEGCLLWWLKNDAKQPQGLDYWTKQPAETEGTE